ncbi:unnamed protein product [Phyllotreta striolata]|uniref:Major facilitator superfamily (MFS) profile domain-containing protein n=1 Tax=Phyllotreta striolata TaxID=444603 RepID=A0A9N9TTM9_PHYSR|nr:unnamed protein product [Phyllotreta striolata]
MPDATVSKKGTSSLSIFSSKSSLKLPVIEDVIPDGGYGWIVVFATFLIYAIAEGITFAFGLLYIEFLDEFKATKSATSVIGSLFVALPLVGGPICSLLVNAYGCQKMTIVGSAICALGFIGSAYSKSLGVMYLTYGVLGGLSRGLCYITVVVSVAYWFDKRRSLALGISASGTGFGTIIFAPLTNFLLSEYGWRGCLLLLGGCLANMCVCGALMIDPAWVREEEVRKKRKKKLESNDTEINNLLEETTKESVPTKKWYEFIFTALSSFDLFLESHFLLLCLTTLFAGTWFLTPYFYLADHMTQNNYTEDQASMTISIIGFSNTLGMVLLGWLGDKWNVSIIFSVSLTLCGFSVWAIILSTSSLLLLNISSGLFGFFFACCFTLSPSLLAQIVSKEDFTMAYGLILMWEGIGHITGPPLAGYIADISKSWSQSFYQAGFWIVIAGMCLAVIACTKNRRLFGKSKRQQVDTNEP